MQPTTKALRIARRAVPDIQPKDVHWNAEGYWQIATPTGPYNFRTEELMAREIEYSSEKDVKREVKKILDKTGWFYWMPAANAFGKAGTSDILALRSGVFLAVETKFGRKKPSAMQVAFLNSINAEDGMGFVVNDRTVEIFREWMDLFLKSAGNMQQSGGKIAPEDGARMLDLMRTMTEDLVLKAEA